VVSLAEQNMVQLKELACGKRLNWFLTGVIEDFLRSKDFSVPERLTTAERRQHWEADGKCIFCGTTPADEEKRTCSACWKKNADRQKKAPEPFKAAEPVPEEPKPTQANVAPAQAVPAANGEPRASYAERRVAALTVGSPPVPPRLHRHKTKSKKSTIRVLWTTCSPKSFVETDAGMKEIEIGPQPTTFRSEEEAIDANEAFAKEIGYKEQVLFCEVHQGWHLKHIWSGRSLADAPCEAAVGKRY